MCAVAVWTNQNYSCSGRISSPCAVDFSPRVQSEHNDLTVKGGPQRHDIAGWWFYLKKGKYE